MKLKALFALGLIILCGLAATISTAAGNAAQPATAGGNKMVSIPDLSPGAQGLLTPCQGSTADRINDSAKREGISRDQAVSNLRSVLENWSHMDGLQIRARVRAAQSGMIPPVAAAFLVCIGQARMAQLGDRPAGASAAQAQPAASLPAQGSALAVRLPNGAIAVSDGPGSMTKCRNSAWEPGSMDKRYSYIVGYGYGSEYWLNWQILVVTNNCPTGVWVLSASCVEAHMIDAGNAYGGALTDLSGGSGHGAQFVPAGRKMIISYVGQDNYPRYADRYQFYEAAYAGYSDSYAKSAAGSAHIWNVKREIWHRLNAMLGRGPEYNLGGSWVNRPEQMGSIPTVGCGFVRMQEVWATIR